MARTLKILISIFLIFSLHRYYAWSMLAEQYGTRNVSLWREILVGSLSDIWVAGIFSLPLWAFEYFPSKRARSWHKLIGALVIITAGLLTAGHQSYVEFFKFQIIPFHLAYIIDPSFIKGNGTSVFDPASAIILIATTSLLYWNRKAQQIHSKRALNAGLFFALGLIGVSHALNIRWRINWFVIEPLQTNYIESLYANLGKKPNLRKLSAEEKNTFSQMTGQTSWLWVDKKYSNNDGPLAAIKAAIKPTGSKSKPIILGLIVAESLRSSDVGPRPKDGQSLTANLDQLQELGVKFLNVYSTGPVTRGGQEATWCGTPSATDTSLMRSYPDLSVTCLPKIFRDDSKLLSLWTHGGDERFDSQMMFWTHQGVGRFVTKSDFSENTPVTSWGISDLSLFEKTAQTLQSLTEAGKISTILSMTLTVTNHIPWALPDDASLETKRFVAPHPSHKTIKYFDESLALFVESLKEKGIWDNAIFIVTGDHGNLEKPWREDYASDPNKWERLLSHVSVTLTGGIIERLRKSGALPREVQGYTAQSQIASFLYSLATVRHGDPLKARLWDSPLFSDSPWVIASDLNQYLFLPADGIRLAKEDVLAGKIAETDARPWLASVRYRGWLEFLYSSKTGH